MADKRFLKGLFKDTGHIDQPEGSWRHARNMVINQTEGAVSNEGGTVYTGHLGASGLSTTPSGNQNDKVIGAIEVSEDRAILFITDVVTNSSFYPRSEIGIWEKTVGGNSYKTLLNMVIDPTSGGKETNDLNFRTSHPIQGTFKIDPKGDLIVYWTDDLNPPRAFNVDRQLRESANLYQFLYGISSTQLDNIDILNLFPYSGPVPHIDVDDQGTHQGCVIEGGGLLTAVYYLALAYVDDDLVATNYLTVSNPISIVDEFDYTDPTTKKDGAKEGSQTTKAIKWEISNLNVDYKFLRPVIIRSKGDAQEAFKLNDVEYSASSTSVIYSGLETSATGSPAEVIIDTIGYDTAKTIQQLDNVLYLGNTTGSKDLGYQKYANNIKLRSRVDLIEDFDIFYASVDNFETGWGSKPVNSFGQDSAGLPIQATDVDPTKSYRYQPNIFKNKGYMRDEIYAFYIAFVLKDGSTSYAYHIPGREDLDDELLTTDGLQGNTYGHLWEDIHTVSPSYGKRFHWLDSVTPGILGSSTYNINTYMGMNYWENATELYPNTDNYEVWDETNGGKRLPGAAGFLQGKNVRHHHFPSNRNQDRKSITDDKLCRTTKSAGTTPVVDTWVGKLAMLDIEDGQEISPKYNNGSYWTKNRFQGSPDEAAIICSSFGKNGFNGYSNDVDMQAALYNKNNSTFTADQEMEVRVRFTVVHNHRGGNDPNAVKTRVRKTIQGATSTVIQDDDGSPIKWNCCGYQGQCGTGSTHENYLGFNSSGGTCGSFCSSNNSKRPCANWSNIFTMNAGDIIWVESQKSSESGGSTYQTGFNYYGNSCVSTHGTGAGIEADWGFSFIEFDVTAAGGLVEEDDYHDAKINHNVQRLGFDLENIKIPQSIADKVQGFRVYYANRKHSDRTVLGQSILIPSLYKREILGICSESSSDIDEASQILSALQANSEEFYNMDPWARVYYEYPIKTHDDEQGGSVGPAIVDQWAMDVFTFHDFYLLRSKNSLSSATHIDIQYTTRNLAWNGTGLDQDKKMVTTLTPPSDPTDPLKVKEVWGWDANQNCYPQKMKTAIFIGANYMPVSSLTQPRLIGQKSKTYLLGDTIFEGSDLGFGGKLFNEFGESSIALRLKDNHSLGAYRFRSYPRTNTIGYFADTYGPAPASELVFGHYGRSHGGYSILTNTLDSTGTFTNSSSTPSHHQRSQSAMVNLKAFKTDVYKSIDSQELVWTGFEVLGENLNEYVFDSSGDMITGGTGNTIDTHPDGIYGGDTFICRYGVATSLKPSNPKQTAEPEKAIHYHIVESTDNINFRHLEDKDSLYFPNSVAKSILRNSGIKDFTHFDNLKYNSNYSELNTIRPAFPLPLRDVIQDDFPTRTHRSAKHDTTSIIDNYRIFLANQFKDLPKNRGDLWQLSSFNNLLYFHMESSLFAAQGKQSMQMNDGSEAFVGSGDIFAQEPNELVHTKKGFGGTQSQYAALTTRYGYFFVDRISKKVFVMKEQLEEISNLGMEKWFQDNLGFFMETDYMMNPACVIDNPIQGIGLHTTYDPKFKRILLTKRDVKPTQAFLDGWNIPNTLPVTPGKIGFDTSTCTYRIYLPCPAIPNVVCSPWTSLKWDDINYFDPAGWTISYYPEVGVWGGFHDYVPYIYFSTSINFYSLTDQYPRPVWSSGILLEDHFGTSFGNVAIWEHSNPNTYGIIYQENEVPTLSGVDYTSILNHYPLEFEFIHNEFKAEDTLVASFNYTLETFNQAGISVLEHGFTSFFIYNTFQLSGVGQDWLDSAGIAQTDSNGITLTEDNINTLEYLVNIRRVGNNWKVNHFRDMANIAANTNPYYMSTNINVIGGVNTGTVTSSSIENMFIYNGMSKSVNASYLDLTKNWNLQRKFIDKWVGIRLIYDNISNNLLNLYATNVAVRKSFR